ncbi:hypothetical protein [Halodesulfovibrio spirochaetisodalis]|uniref:Uncharacterized protein n=1 Tax=Halodesulfovibrio spirochaetisodalis TaxID=1560234 RepID=A0A1B7XA39_9BACT|nr:hypothetical protein [Halodesulfovibrio spirochaetisodalis]OBQ46244.1 hypothetical protein SP90_13690 [Halodesulfovibrio spirochaetisodalis]
MEKLQEVMNEVFVEYEKSGKIKELFENNIESCIAKVVEEEFRYSGKARKAIKSAIEKALPENIEATLNIVEYNHVVSNILKEKLGGLFTEESKRMADNLVDDLLEVPAKEITLHELAEAFVEQYSEEAQEEDWGYPQIKLEDSHYSWADDGEFYNITFKPHEDSWRDEIVLRVHQDKVHSVRFGDEEKYKKKFSGHDAQVHDFEKLVFQLYACRIKLVRGDFDEDNYSYPDRY